MTRETDDELRLGLPTSLFKPANLRSSSQAQGFFIPFKEGMPPSLVIPSGHKQGVIFLAAPTSVGNEVTAMSSFELDISASMSGLLIEQTEFVIDLTTGRDTSDKAAERGSLLLQEGKLHIKAANLKSTFRDDMPVELWGSYEGVGTAPSVGFSRWDLVVRNRDTVVTLWKHR